jgi:pSer/pThr/pTyr-binding forkhead associated (FHA) protein
MADPADSGERPTPLIEKPTRDSRPSLPVIRLIGTERVRLVVLTLGSTIEIGRDESCGLVLADDSVSRRHAVVRTDREGYVLEDLGSRNGTRVDGEPVTKALITPGDRIEIGSVLLRFDLVTAEELVQLQQLAERP